MHFVEVKYKKYKNHKNEIELKIKNLTQGFIERQTLCFTSHKNRKLKVKLCRAGACERKKEGIFRIIYFAQMTCL